uniref:Uncharacterized protein n=1 Tax=Candidatus Kentrum sp. LFY TaxID=2126342 RepID=A0A450UK73_9GAMM|nr:MAG: hypothetical protein BECKLFY1418B_GA0070995_102022 [Candidatus Kentron sp. LFY]VFJ92904.1 MAG: hypothetical protein BECKLFY1418A_GA0070994_102710 [Candidatus Kentron sp. LFY]
MLAKLREVSENKDPVGTGTCTKAHPTSLLGRSADMFKYRKNKNPERTAGCAKTHPAPALARSANMFNADTIDQADIDHSNKWCRKWRNPAENHGQWSVVFSAIRERLMVAVSKSVIFKA